MESVLRVAVGLVLLALGALLGLYGLFAILYGGDSRGGNTYVKFGGHKIDADLAGAVSLFSAVVVISAAFFILRRRRRFARPT
jgi:divalent metal cation (Fe/Co/Zn/Cd) transporter